MPRTEQDQMLSRHAICYVASDGYLLQTTLSAIQARAHAPAAVPIFIVHLNTAESSEAVLFRRALAESGVELIEGSPELLGSLHLAFGRLFLPEFLPPHVTEVLYLDGDTQIRSDLSPLLFAEPPTDGLIAVKDPMVLSHGSSSVFRRTVESWWSESKIPLATRPLYINSGVFRVRRDTLKQIRIRVQQILLEEGEAPRFLDQDLLNRVMAGRIATTQLDWNFPGFLLGTKIAERCNPRIIHFMSDPRPWQAPFRPWGRKYFRPYAELVEQFPELATVWQRASLWALIRFNAQQAYKYIVERPAWQSDHAAHTLERMQTTDLRLG